MKKSIRSIILSLILSFALMITSTTCLFASTNSLESDITLSYGKEASVRERDLESRNSTNGEIDPDLPQFNNGINSQMGSVGIDKRILSFDASTGEAEIELAVQGLHLTPTNDPIAICMVMDVSGSMMYDNRITKSIEAVKMLLGSVLGEAGHNDTIVSLVTFKGNATAYKFDGNAWVKNKSSYLGNPNSTGITTLYGAVNSTTEDVKLNEGTFAQGGFIEAYKILSDTNNELLKKISPENRYVVFLTDGMPNKYRIGGWMWVAPTYSDYRCLIPEGVLKNTDGFIKTTWNGETYYYKDTTAAYKIELAESMGTSGTFTYNMVQYSGNKFTSKYVTYTDNIHENWGTGSYQECYDYTSLACDKVKPLATIHCIGLGFDQTDSNSQPYQLLDSWRSEGGLLRFGNSNDLYEIFQEVLEEIYYAGRNTVVTDVMSDQFDFVEGSIMISDEESGKAYYDPNKRAVIWDDFRITQNISVLTYKARINEAGMKAPAGVLYTNNSSSVTFDGYKNTAEYPANKPTKARITMAFPRAEVYKSTLEITKKLQNDNSSQGFTINLDALNGGKAINAGAYDNSYVVDSGNNYNKSKYFALYSIYADTVYNNLSVSEPSLPAGYSLVSITGTVAGQSADPAKFSLPMQSHTSIIVTNSKNQQQLYTVTFNANGGTPVPASQTVQPGEKAVKPADPVKAGYIFEGWYQKQDFDGNVWNFNNPVSDNMILYAKWSAIPVEKIVTVNIYVEKTSGQGNYTLYLWNQLQAFEGDVIVSSSLVTSIGGYTFSHASPTQLTVSDSSNVINLFYNRVRN